MKRLKLRSSWLTTVIVLAIPLITSVLTMITVSEPPHTSTGQPALNAAIVNNDQIVTESLGGESVPVPAGRMLVGELVTNPDDGFSWVITNAETASAGLASGEFSAVVTIPQNFSASYISSTTENPVQATINVQTDGSHSYLAAIIAQSLASSLPDALSNQLTSGFIENLLLGYTALSDGMGEVATGANELTVGLNEIAKITAELPAATNELADGSKLVDAGLNELAKDLWQLAAFSQTSVESSATVVTQIASLKSYVDSASFDPTVKAAILGQLASLETSSATTATNALETDAGIDLGALAADVLKAASGLVSAGNSELAAGMPLLNEGVSGAAAGSGALSSGLSEVAADIPNYTKDQASTLSNVVANPIKTEQVTNPKLPKAVGAVGAVIIPVALWLGALALSFVRDAFSARALGTRASNLRIVSQASLPLAGMAALQGALIVVAIFALQLEPLHPLAFILLTFAAAISFVLLHQGLAALTGRFAWLISLALLALQILAAGVVLPALFVPDWVLTLGSVLPLSQAISGAQEVITGGSLANVTASILWLIVTGVLGLVLTLFAVARGRRISSSRL